MLTREVTLCGKKVILAYSFRTEMCFYKITGKPVTEMTPGDPTDSISMVMAAVIAYAQSQKQEPPLDDIELMDNAKPTEIIEAINAISEMTQEMYEVPDDVAAKNKPKEGKGKTKKNA